MVLEWEDDADRHRARLRDVELTTGEDGRTQTIDHEGRTFGASHTYVDRFLLLNFYMR